MKCVFIPKAYNIFAAYEILMCTASATWVECRPKSLRTPEVDRQKT